jgi:integrase
VDAWCAAAGITSGPLFRRVDRWGRVGEGRMSPGTVAEVVKRAAGRAGLDPDRYAGHSLRAGFCTTAAARGASERSIARQTGHAPNSSVLRSYIRHATPFVDNAATDLGL